MERTESKSIEVRGSEEQERIDLMQKFRWSLLGSQPITRTETNNAGMNLRVPYAKLQFQRPLAFEHDKVIRELEKAFFALQEPKIPERYPAGQLVCAAFAYIWIFYYFLSYRKNFPIATGEVARVRQRRLEILEEIEKYQ